MASLDSKIKIILFIFLLFRALGRGLFFIIDSQGNFNRLIAVITLPILLLSNSHQCTKSIHKRHLAPK